MNTPDTRQAKLIERGENIFKVIVQAAQLLRTQRPARVELPGIGVLIRQPTARSAPPNSVLVLSFAIQGSLRSIYLEVASKEVAKALVLFRASFAGSTVAPPKGSAFITKLTVGAKPLPRSPPPKKAPIKRQRPRSRSRNPGSGVSIHSLEDAAPDMPELSQREGAGPPAEAEAVAPEVMVSVFYATDRKPTTSKAPNTFYGSDRDNVVHTGIAQVSIPDNHRIGELERPLFSVLKENPKKHVVLRSLEELAEKEFLAEVSRGLGALDDKVLLIFIHGFNVSFAEAARRLGQMTYDMFCQKDRHDHSAHLSVTPLLYSWPSEGKAASYFHDSESVVSSRTRFKKFLCDTLKKVQPEKVVLVGHSMGCRLLAESLHEIALEMNKRSKVLVHEIIMAAPDIDRGRFLDLAEQIKRTGTRVTLYASAKDRALKLSYKANGFLRLGDTNGGITIVPGIDSIDASTVGADLLAHSYIARATVMADIHSIIKHASAPGDRFGLDEVGESPSVYWRIRG